MRQVTVKEISELTDDEVEVLLTNATVRQEIIAYANENESYWLDEVFTYIKDSLSDWSIDMPFNSFIKVKLYREFYASLKYLDDAFSLFYNTDIMERLEHVYSTYDVYSDDFIKHMKAIENDIAIVFGDYATYYYSFTVLELESDYVNLWCEAHYDTECVVDGDSVTLLNY